MRNGLPIFALIALVLFISIGVMFFGTTMQLVDKETNYTKTNETQTPYVVMEAWWFGIAVLLVIIAMAFALWLFL